MNLLGHSTGVYYKQQLAFKEKIKRIAAVQQDVLEINIARHSYLDEVLELEFGLVKKFTYRSLHVPTDLSYPNAFINGNYDKLLAIAKNLHIQTAVFHPDTVTDFAALMDKFKNSNFVIAFENNDVNKAWGQTVSDMQKVFSLAPKAKFVLDLNHLVTNKMDASDVKEFHNYFRDRLAHYHLSGFIPDNIHCTILEAPKRQQEFLLQSVIADKPVVLEGFSGRMESLISKEHELLKGFFAGPTLETQVLH